MFIQLYLIQDGIINTTLSTITIYWKQQYDYLDKDLFDINKYNTLTYKILETSVQEYILGKVSIVNL